MLDRNLLAKNIHEVADKLFPDLSGASNVAQDKWKEIVNDPSFVSRVEAARSSFLLPSWYGNLSDIFEVNSNLKKYSVLAVDGSQIYPDRNVSGASCFLINSGGCFLSYSEKSKVNVFSKPFLYFPDDIVPDNSFSFSRDLVDLKREEIEFKILFEKFKEFSKTLSEETFNVNVSTEGQKKIVCLSDGSLVFWHLEGKTPKVKKHFLNQYLFYLDQFYRNDVPIAGYISFPKSRELVNLIKIGLCRFTVAECISCHSQYDEFPCQAVDSLIDTQVVKSFLPREKDRYFRTTVFRSNSKIVEEYPDHLKPCFFYLDVGNEIVRIEIPRFVAEDKKKLDLIASVALDQSLKGYGYPVCLAESHEQAVVKGPDRNFFYHLLQKIGIENQKRIFHSQKSIKKRGLGV